MGGLVLQGICDPNQFTVTTAIQIVRNLNVVSSNAPLESLRAFMSFVGLLPVCLTGSQPCHGEVALFTGFQGVCV